MVFAIPRVTYTLKGTDAGIAYAIPWSIRLNGYLLEHNTEIMITEIIPHEVAHLIDVKVNLSEYADQGFIPRHGPHWKKVMQVFQCIPRVCHTMDTVGLEVDC